MDTMMMPVLLALIFLFRSEPQVAPVPTETPDSARLREMLHDRQHPRQQSQAALMLVQSPATEALEIVRQGLRQTEAPEVFMALSAAVRLCRDPRFQGEMLAALRSARPEVRQQAGETLAVFANADVVRKLQALAEDDKAEVPLRQTAIWALGRSGSKSAAVALLDLLSSDVEVLRRSAALALEELTGQECGHDAARWRAWWLGHKEVDSERWLQERLVYQASRARRLEGELERAKAQVVRLHQQLYARLPAADRLGHVQSLVEHDDPAVRGLAVGWSSELLPSADAVGQRSVAEVLLRLSRDSAIDVQRPAVLALGRVHDVRAFDRLKVLLRRGPAPVRAAAARALTEQAKQTRPENAVEARARQRQVVPALQRALDDSALEVVIEAAEDLGSLGLPEAVPVLTALLRHSSEAVRQTAAQALERVADASVVGALLEALDDSAVTVRFSIVGALGHAAGDGRSLPDSLRERLLARLEELLQRDTDPGVRSRVATVLGECGSPAVLPALWRRVLAAEDARVQDKAWAALIAVVARSRSLELLKQWDKAAAEAKLPARRIELLAAVLDTWKKNNEKVLATAAAEALVPAQLEQGKWAAAFPLVRELLHQPGSDADVGNRLRWLWSVGEQALKEGNRAEVLRVVQEAQSFLPRQRSLAADFERLDKQARALKE